jgi:citrate lyase subunit beta/citryl-CoA lyase
MLFAPGDSEKKLRKALDAGADAVIFDLEDAVSPSTKSEARRITRLALEEKRKCKVGVRINGRGTPWHLEDIAVITAGRPDFIMVPKCAGVQDLAIIDHQLAVLETVYGCEVGRIGVIPLVTETADSLLSLDYRTAPNRLLALCFAGEDLSADLGVAARGASGVMSPLLTIGRHMTAIAAAAAGVPAIDTPFPDPRDQSGLVAETTSAAELGFAGKLCIHPAQIVVIHEVFRPSDQQLDWARAVVAAFEASPDVGVALLDGKMIDKAHLRLALRRIASASCGDTAAYE